MNNEKVAQYSGLSLEEVQELAAGNYIQNYQTQKGRAQGQSDTFVPIFYLSATDFRIMFSRENGTNRFIMTQGKKLSPKLSESYHQNHLEAKICNRQKLTYVYTIHRSAEIAIY